MTSREILKDREVHNMIRLLAERWVDLSLPPDRPISVSFEVDAEAVDAIEEALCDVHIPTPAEWSDDLDERADREREESLGL